MSPGTAVTVCGSFSRYPVSLGRAMHEAGYRALGLAYVYAPFAVSDLAAAVAAIRALGLRGVGVSMPFKIDVLRLLDSLSPLARRIGAVNTIVNDGNYLRGHNTDAQGAVRALEETRPVGGQAALVLGAGGAARAVVAGLLDAGARVTISNRTEVRAERLAADFGVRTVPWAEREQRAGDHSIIVNATAAGMTDIAAASPLRAGLAPGQVVLDAVYKPVQTEMLAYAKAAGAVAINGSRMLLHQAMAQFELYTGLEAPRQAMEAALADALT